jgi:hypothetical protein
MIVLTRPSIPFAHPNALNFHPQTIITLNTERPHGEVSSPTPTL